jgi:two-component system phosphate regulon sensor histidine kinase PhoR
MHFTFAKKLTLSYLFVVLVTLVLTGLLFTRRLRSDFISHLEQSLVSQAILTRADTMPAFEQKVGAYQSIVQALARETGSRITLIRADGTVISDSEQDPGELAGMENHLMRPEVQAALNTGSGKAIRYSKTLQEDMLYVAVPAVSSGKLNGVVRTALPLTEVNRRISTFQKDLLRAGAAAMIFALAIAVLSVRRVSRPLEKLTDLAQRIGRGEYPAEQSVETPDEFGQLAKTLVEMSKRIQEKVQELNLERTQLAAILSALVESVIAVDHEGKILFLNPAAESLFRVSALQVKGRPMLEALRHSVLSDVIAKTLTGKKVVAEEITVHSPEEHILAVQALPVAYGEGRTGILVALNDITDLRKLERVRQEFVANVTHELKTPLTSIKGFTETLLDGALEDPSHNREFLTTIQEHATRLGFLIDDLLDLAAIEAKRMEYRFESVSVPDVVERILKGLAPMAKGGKIQIQNDLSPSLPKVRADRDKLAQVFINLIDNAIKFNKPNGLIKISAEAKGKNLVISVRDSGIGIPQTDLPRIFERFYRVDKARSREMGGTGLGLSIVKHLVEAHHGTVSVQSIVDQGSNFTVSLPLAL